MSIQFSNITKRFAGVTALDNVSLNIAAGECHGLMGENGAGKSTLGKILAGIHRPDDGGIIIEGEPRVFRSPADALRAGVGMVHQELAFCPELSVAENLCMGQYPRRMRLFVDRREMTRRAERLLAQIGVRIDVDQPMHCLSTAQEQLVQIAAAVGTNARVLVFDEPTSSLAEPDAQQLFRLIDQLKSRGVTIIYVSHRMPELFRLCDRISVLRDGKYVGTLDRASANQDAIVRMMIGRSVQEYFPQHVSSAPGETMLRVENLGSPTHFENVSFEIRAGEIVGFAGLVGAGRSEVAKAIFGLDSTVTGSVQIGGKPLKLRSIRESMRHRIGLLPEDRKRQGLVLTMSCRNNLSLAMLDRLSRMGLLSHSHECDLAHEYFKKLRVKAPSIEVPVAGLSGGNQQKVAIAKWLARQAKLLIVDEPTRGVDVGAKAAIHELIDELARQGVAIMLISSELPEVVNLSTRIIVMRQGRIVGEVSRRNATQENVLRLMAGVEQ
ncbi:MAG TPA: sugar ABC transporter ATP-binding protein [Tepidisphaeraceae bacterium]|nr:sugar ABC transporter ATP-binding protein [Tepidisphaeraceae bacterium]